MIRSIHAQNLLWIFSFDLLLLIGNSVSFQFVGTPHQVLSQLQLSARAEPSTNEPVNLTVVIPAYNEALRIGETLRSYSDYFTTNPCPELLDSCKILVVDDGSIDGTADLVRSYDGVECISLPTNQGKGAAVAYGIDQLPAGELCLIADADGSANMVCLDAMMKRLVETIESSPWRDSTHVDFWSTPAVVVGNRGSSSLSSLTTSSFVRSILRWGFRTVVQLFAGDVGVDDTQCGFKLMTVSAAKPLYKNLNLQRWTHDVEVLYRARKMNIPVMEQPIEWLDKEGSKLVNSPGGTIGVSLIMLLEVLQMRLAYETGQWKVPSMDE